MKKSIIKSTLAVVAIAASCLGAWKTYDAYGSVDNSLMMQNIEALSGGTESGGEGGDPSEPIQFPIVRCGHNATSQNMSCWHSKEVQCKRNCYQFANANELIEWKKNLVQDKTKTMAQKRYILSQAFCTGPMTYFHLTEEGENRGYCINTENY